MQVPGGHRVAVTRTTEYPTDTYRMLGKRQLKHLDPREAHTLEYLAALLFESSNREAYGGTRHIHTDDLPNWQARTVHAAITTVARTGIDSGYALKPLAATDVHDHLRDEGHLDKEPMRRYWHDLVAPAVPHTPARHRLKQLACRIAEDHLRQKIGDIYAYGDHDSAPLGELLERMARDRQTMLDIYARTGHTPNLRIVEKEGA